eukprot:ctg_1963.g416
MASAERPGGGAPLPYQVLSHRRQVRRRALRGPLPRMGTVRRRGASVLRERCHSVARGDSGAVGRGGARERRPAMHVLHRDRARSAAAAVATRHERDEHPGADAAHGAHGHQRVCAPHGRGCQRPQRRKRYARHRSDRNRRRRGDRRPARER